MTNQQDSHFGAETKEKKPVFPIGMLIVIELYSVFVKEDRLGFRECDAVLPMVVTVLCLIPFELQSFIMTL